MTELESRWPRGFDVEKEDIEARNLYIKFKNWQYQTYEMQDDTLWEQYKEDFTGFTAEHFKDSNTFATRSLRITLRTRGVWVKIGRRTTVPDSLFETLQEKQPMKWSQLDIDEHIQTHGGFRSGKINHILHPTLPPISGSSGNSSGNPGNTGPLDPTLTTPPIRDPARDITNLAKLYSDDQKYSGQEDNFDFHLIIFNNHCSQLGIQDDSTKSKAYSLMLKGQALDHFFTNLRSTTATVPFNDLCNSTRNYFETTEYRRSQLNKWNSITLRTVMADTKNTGKSTKECLQLLITELRHIQPSLDSSLRTDLFLHSKLITACQDIPACEYACFKPSDSLSGLINDLQSSITTYEKTHPPDPPSAFFTDRRFHRKEPHFSRFPPSRFPPRPPTYQKRQQKRCFVCKKEGCWSTKHTEEEREESRKRFRNQLQRNLDQRVRQYITEYEGEEEDNDANNDEVEVDDHDINAFIMDYECGDEEAEQFLTTTVNALSDQSLHHALTKSVPYDNTQDPFAYTSGSRYTSDKFYGIMVDTGASKVSTAGWGQYLAYQRSVDANATIDDTTAGSVNVQFGIGSTPSVGSLTVTSPVGTVEFHIVKADTPFLLCLADMNALQVYYNNVKNIMVTPSTTIPVTLQFGHPFVLWGRSFQQFITSSLTQNPCYLTSAELSRLHRRFGHPSIERLHALLKRAGQEVDKKSIERLTKFCSYCQKHSKSPGRFKFRLADETLDFNHSIYVDIMYIDSMPVLHVIDEATRFTAARFLKDISAKYTWETLRLCWIDIYLGPPDHIVHDAGKNFTSKEFRQNASSMAVTTKCVPVEAHWSIGLIERAHATLRRAYQIIKEELGATAPKEVSLQMAVKAVNDSSGPEGLVPTLLVFGAFPRMVASDDPAPTISQRATAIRKAMDEIAKVRAKMQVNNALNARNGPTTESLHDLPLNSDVLVWREDSGWKGPFKLINITEETCKVLLPSGPTDFRSTVVKPYLQSSDENPNQDQDKDQDQAEDDQAEDNQPRPHRERRLPSRYRQNVADISILLQEPSYTDSRHKEINGLLEKGVFQLVNITTVPHGTRIFNSRFVDEIKNKGTDHAFEKSRLVVQAYNDYEKELVLTQSPTIQRASQRLILALAPTLGSTSVYLRDISQAYVQSTTLLNRDFYVRPPQEINEILQLGKSTILKVIKPLYGIPEAGNHWFHTYHRHHTEKLSMTESTFDPCLLYSHDHDTGFGVVGLQTDDTLFLGDNAFATAEEVKLREAGFLAKEREKLTPTTPIKFNGGQIKLEDGVIILTQERQCQNLKLVALKEINITSSRGEVRQAVTPKDQYVAQRARGAYIATVCQPEASFDLSFAAQVVNPKEEDAKKLNKRLQWQIDNQSRGLRFVPLDKNSLKLVVFTDSSFANNKDNTSQIGFVITIADKNNNANIVHWSSIKCKRVTRSVLASELYGMAHGFDHGAVIKATIEKILQISLPLVLCTDSKSLYDCLVKLGTTQEKRLMVDLMCLRQSYERRLITEIKWIDGNSNPADAMTKSKPCQALRDLIDTNKVNLSTIQWVEREVEGSVGV